MCTLYLEPKRFYQLTVCLSLWGHQGVCSDGFDGIFVIPFIYCKKIDTHIQQFDSISLSSWEKQTHKMESDSHINAGCTRLSQFVHIFDRNLFNAYAGHQLEADTEENVIIDSGARFLR